MLVKPVTVRTEFRFGPQNNIRIMFFKKSLEKREVFAAFKFMTIAIDLFG